MANAPAAVLGGIEPSESPDAWKLAKARFLDGLDESQQAIFHEAKVENLLYSASNVQREDQKISKTRSVLKNIQPLISAIEDYGKALDAYANISPIYLAPIWGSIRVVLVIANNHSHFYSRMVDVFGRIGDILPRFRDYQMIFDARKHQRFTQTLSVAYLDIIQLCTEFKTLLQTQEKSTMKRIFQPLSPTLNARLEEAVARFRKHRKEVDKEAEVCHMIDEKEARDVVLRNSQAAEARERASKQENLLAQLSKVDYKYKHGRMQKIRHPGTGAWFMTLPEFKDWRDGENSAVMCCYGIPGCGKSVLASSLVDGLLSSTTCSEAHATTTFYYCDHADKRTLDPVNIFRCIAQQLLRSLGDLPTDILDSLEDLCQETKASDVDDVIQIIIELTKGLTLVIFMDGLDEIFEHERKFVFHHLRRFLVQKTSSVKIFITSREDTSYLTQEPNVRSFKIRIGTNAISSDIESYVKHEVRHLIHRHELVVGNLELEAEIVAALVGGAKGLFLWVKFQLDDLCTAETDEEIRTVLQNLPKSLSETYDRLLGRIDGDRRREYAKRMFSWNICARRPLQVDELREAIAFTIADTRWDSEKIPNDVNRLVRACGNLILIDEETQNVQLAHYTVQQYLLHRSAAKSNVFHIIRKKADLEIGELCVAYLSFTDFETQVTKFSDTITPGLTALEEVVGTRPLIPSTVMINLMKVLARLRGAQHTPTNIQYNRQINIHNGSTPPMPLSAKFSLLPYIVENWLFHTTEFIHQPENPISLRDHRPWILFDRLALEKQLLFDFKPWNCVKLPERNTSHILLYLRIGWAISANHVPLLQAIVNRYSIYPITHYLAYVANWFFDTFAHPGQTHIHEWRVRELQKYSLDAFLSLEGCGGWLYYCLISTGSQDRTDALIFCLMKFRICISDHEYRPLPPLIAKVLGHILLEAVVHGQGSLIQSLVDMMPLVHGWPLPYGDGDNMLDVTIDYAGLVCNAIEVAALSGCGDVMELLADAGIRVSTSFKAALLQSTIIRETVESGDIARVRSLLKAFGAADAALRDIEHVIFAPEERPMKDASALSLLVHHVRNHLRLRRHYHVTHWIWAIEGEGCEDMIDLLLASGALPLAEDGTWLLRNAIDCERSDRLKLLTEVGVTTMTAPLSDQL